MKVFRMILDFNIFRMILISTFNKNLTVNNNSIFNKSIAFNENAIFKKNLIFKENSTFNKNLIFNENSTFSVIISKSIIQRETY